MEQQKKELYPNTTTSPKPNNNKPSQRKLPSPQDLISHYQSQGLDTEAASLKVIEDLQNVLFRVISSSNKKRKNKFMVETSRKIDGVSSRVAIVDMKVDSKPGYIESFVIGIGSVAAFKGIESSVWPHVVGGFGQIWSSVKSLTNPSSSSPST